MLDPPDVLCAQVLIVDDQEVNVLLLQRMLRGAGYQSVTSTLDPSRVCELHRKNHYDLILLDLQMPGMDGFRVLEGLKEVERDGYLSVLVMTAHPGHKERAMQAGAKDFISKPFNAVEVLTRVYNLLELRLLHVRHKKTQTRARRLPETAAGQVTAPLGWTPSAGLESRRERIGAKPKSR